MVFGPHHAILPCNKYTLIWSLLKYTNQRAGIYQRCWSAVPKGSSKSLFKSSMFCLYHTQQDPVSFSCRLLHTKHSFCVLTCFLLNLVRHAKLHTRNYWRQRSSQYLSLKQHFVNVFISGKAQNCRFLFVHIPIYSVWKCVFATTYYL